MTLMQRLAWFSPMPPIRSGIARCSADLVAALAGEYAIDVYVDEATLTHRRSLADQPPPRLRRSAGALAKAEALRAKADKTTAGKAAVHAATMHERALAEARTASAHDFVWRHRQAPYDLVVYQVGNSSNHDYIWPYLFRFPGLTVLHDAHLHHARAAALLRTRRADDYRAEFAAAHPGVSPDAAELAVAGFDSNLYYMWPMTRLAVQASRLTAVHTAPLAAQLRADLPGAAIEAIRLGHGVAVSETARQRAREEVRRRYGLAGEVVFGCFGGLMPEKRIPQVLDAFAALLPYAPDARLLLAGAPAPHYDLDADIAVRSLRPSVVTTGYLESDEELTTHIAACDVGINLRWPTAREVSGPWLRCLAAGLPTIVIDLAHVDVPSLDPRTWLPNRTTSGGTSATAPVAVAIDIVDEDHSLRLAMRRLANDGELRASLGRAATEYWEREHATERMIEDYRRIIPLAMTKPVPRPMLPAHLVNDGDATLRDLLKPFGMAEFEFHCPGSGIRPPPLAG